MYFPINENIHLKQILQTGIRVHISFFIFLFFFFRNKFVEYTRI